MASFRNEFLNVLLLQEVEEINTMGKIPSQAETLALTNEERNALPSHGHRGWGGGRIFNLLLISKILDPDFHGSSYQERNSCFASSGWFKGCSDRRGRNRRSISGQPNQPRDSSAKPG